MDEAPPPRTPRARPQKSDEKPHRQDSLTPRERKTATVNQIAKAFYGVNEAVAAKLDDNYYEVSSEESRQWAESFLETSEWLGIGEIPPPLTLLAITLNIYIPRAFHYWVTGRDVLTEQDEAALAGMSEREPPPFVDVPG